MILYKIFTIENTFSWLLDKWLTEGMNILDIHASCPSRSKSLEDVFQEEPIHHHIQTHKQTQRNNILLLQKIHYLSYPTQTELFWPPFQPAVQDRSTNMIKLFKKQPFEEVKHPENLICTIQWKVADFTWWIENDGVSMFASLRIFSQASFPCFTLM